MWLVEGLKVLGCLVSGYLRALVLGWGVGKMKCS